MLTLIPLMAGLVSRAAIVTGGTKGIGSGISKTLASRGFDLLLTYNTDAESARNFATEIVDEHSVAVHLVGGDLASDDASETVFEVYDSAFGDSHVLSVCVHCAGQYVGVTSANKDSLGAVRYWMGEGDPFPGKWADYYTRLYGMTFVQLSEEALKRMSHGGAIVGISSPGCSLHYTPQPGYALPGLGKSMMEYSSRLIALSGAEKGVTCNIIVPSAVSSSAWQKISKSTGRTVEELVSGIRRKSPIKQAMAPEDVGQIVTFLASPSGAFITGNVIKADAGFHLVGWDVFERWVGVAQKEGILTNEEDGERVAPFLSNLGDVAEGVWSAAS